MTANPRRPAFRLRWGADSDVAPEDAAEAAFPPEAEGEPSVAPAWPEPDVAAAEVTAPASPTETAEGGEVAESTEFLHSLVEAMRAVAESSRDTSLTELRSAVEARAAELASTASEQAHELGRLADLDVAGVAEWEKSEQERIRQESERRREARRAQLAKQLTEHEAASQREIESTRRRLADHERELEAFFAQLTRIEDPAAFVAAAKRMPRPPELSRSMPTFQLPRPAETPPAVPARTSEPLEAEAPDDAMAAASGAVEPAAEPPATDDSTGQLAERLAQLDAQLAGTVPSHATPSPAPSANGESSTAIVVKGLGSFGAITSFKQALERIEGIRGVTLSLGPTGEFVYRASHAAEFDLVGAIRTIEGPGASIDEADGSLLVTVSRGR